jgi:hypothetical protein
MIYEHYYDTPLDPEFMPTWRSKSLALMRFVWIKLQTTCDDIPTPMRCPEMADLRYCVQYGDGHLRCRIVE